MTKIENPSLPNNIGNCPLCDKINLPIRESHIIPKFVSDWIKESSSTGFLRSIETPNKREQDGQKQYLLCQACETQLSEYETDLSKLFKLIANYRKQKETVLITKKNTTCHYFNILADNLYKY